MKCAICSRPLGPPEENAHHPFCSKRCRMVDLGKWVSGEYVIAGEPAHGELADAGFTAMSSGEAEE